MPPDDLVQALLIRYDAGAGIGWHKDRPIPNTSSACHWAHQAPCGSGGAEAVGSSAHLRPWNITVRITLSGKARHEWEHSIAELDQTRWSVTFRSMRNRAVSGCPLFELAVFAAPAIEPDGCRTAIPLRLARNAGFDSRQRLPARFRYFVTAFHAMGLRLTGWHARPRSHHLVRDGVIDLILHRPVWSPSTRHYRCPTFQTTSNGKNETHFQDCPRVAGPSAIRWLNVEWQLSCMGGRFGSGSSRAMAVVRPLIG